MRIVLVGIYDTNTVSLAPQILAALARGTSSAASHDVLTREFSLFSDTPLAIAEQLNGLKPDVVCFSLYIWNVTIVTEVVQHLDCTVVVGGPQVSDIEHQLLAENPGIDMIVTGEGEASFLALLDHWCGDRALADVPGITTRSISTAPADPVDLASIPPIYADVFKRYPDITWVTMETSRGCPMRCGYCTWGYTSRMRYFPLDYVLAELDVVLGNPKIESIYLCDSSLLFNKKRALAILDHLIASRTDIGVRYEFAPEQLDDEVIERMAKLPGNEFNLGIQSVNPAALATVGRPFDRGRFEDAYGRFIAAFPDASITVDLIYGLPGDDLGGYLSSLEYVMGLPRLGRVLTNPLIVLPGSRFYRERDRYGIEMTHDGSYLLVSNGTFTAEEMDEARRISFYVNLLYLNTALKEALFAFADDKGQRRVDAVTEFFEGLPFPLVEGEYPNTVPSSPEAFELRNRAVGAVIARYNQLVEAFGDYSQGRYDAMLEDYGARYTEQYRKLSRFAAQSAPPQPR